MIEAQTLRGILNMGPGILEESNMGRRQVIWIPAILGMVLSFKGIILAQNHPLVNAQDGSGIFGYKDTPIQPWSGFHVHDPDRPVPEKVEPGMPSTRQQAGRAPSDALVLFDGKDLTQWHPSEWILENASLIATEGRITSKKEFGSCQLHLEWKAPVEPAESIWNQGNNGVMFLGAIEVQIYDSYRSKIYPDGQAAAIYAQTPPRVNACRPPGEWETYDIVFLAPQFNATGEPLEPARITMFHNGLLVHHNQEIYGDSPHAGLASYRNIKSKGPLQLDAHHCPIRFRNIWIRELE